MSVYDARLALYIGGRWLGGDGRDLQPVMNPANGTTLAELPLADTADLDAALHAAEHGFRHWRATPPVERAAVLARTAALLRDRAERLATIATLEQGKVIAEARQEVAFAAALLEFHAAEGQRVYGRVLPRPSGKRSLVLQQPIGPVAAFCAWNFPITNVVRKLAPALASGCSIILKPSEETPGTAVEILRCFQEAGLPGDVAQCVFGVPDKVSRHLLASPVTRKLSFTGSVAVGKHLARLAADTMMRTTMELGGHAPVLVFDDCDLDQAVEALARHKFRNAGQVCISPTRFLVQEAVYEPFLERMARRMERISVGDGLSPTAHMGPVANERRIAVLADLTADARAKGARVVVGGEPSGDVGLFAQPTLLADVPTTARAMNEEPFAPLVLARPFTDDEEAIREANGLPFGLAAYCFTRDGKRQNILADGLEAGLVSINGAPLSHPDSPFGGMKDSGFGSEDGPEGIAAHLLHKAVHIE